MEGAGGDSKDTLPQTTAETPAEGRAVETPLQAPVRTGAAPTRIVLPGRDDRPPTPLWQWAAVGVGGTLLVLAIARLGRVDLEPLSSAPPPPVAAPQATPTQRPKDDPPAYRPSRPIRASPLGDLGHDRDPGSDPTRDVVRERVREALREARHDAVAASAKPPAHAAPRGKHSFASEGAALDATRAELDRKDGVKAIAILDQFDKDYPQPINSPEARSLRIEAHALRQDDPVALRLADEFLEDFPHSPKADRVRAIRDAVRARQK